MQVPRLWAESVSLLPSSGHSILCNIDQTVWACLDACLEITK